MLADEGRYLVSEAIIYRLFKLERMLTHRKTSRPVTRHRPKPYVADGPNQVWTCDITYLLT